MEPELIVLAIYALFLAVFSPWAYIAMWRDKRAAENGQWRTPEIKLHALELFGGYPGSLLAQIFFRHKNKKRSYQIVFWVIVSVHVIGLTALGVVALKGEANR